MEATDDRKDQQWGAKKEEGINPLYNYEDKPYPVSRGTVVQYLDHALVYKSL